MPSYGDALSLWTLGVETAPSSDYARNNYGAALMDADRFPEAVEQFREGLRLNPDYDKARFNLLNCLEYLGDRTQALRELEILVEQRPTDTALLTRLATMRSREGDLAGAQAAAEKAVALKPDDPTLLQQSRRRARAARCASRRRYALRRRLTELEPQNPVYLASLGRVLAGSGQPAEGRRRLRAFARRRARQRPRAFAARASRSGRSDDGRERRRRPGRHARAVSWTKLSCSVSPRWASRSRSSAGGAAPVRSDGQRM